jgi:hypothetical protein
MILMGKSTISIYFYGHLVGKSTISTGPFSIAQVIGLMLFFWILPTMRRFCYLSLVWTPALLWRSPSTVVFGLSLGPLDGPWEEVVCGPKNRWEFAGKN